MPDYPVNEMLFTNALSRALVEKARGEPELEHAFDTLIRHSDAGKCARFIGMKVAGYERGEPDAAGVWVMWLGSFIHEALQKALLERFPGAEVEARVRWDDLSASGHLDALVDWHGKRYCYELKTMGAAAFDMSVGIDRLHWTWKEKGPTGPKVSAKIQGALNALAAEADELRIGHLGMEAFSKGAAEKLNIGTEARFCAEWAYPRSVFEPWAKRERGRFAHILGLVEHGKLPERWAVDDGFKPVLLNPDAPTPKWQCQYCDMADLCSKAGPGEPALPIPGVK